MPGLRITQNDSYRSPSVTLLRLYSSHLIGLNLSYTLQIFGKGCLFRHLKGLLNERSAHQVHQNLSYCPQRSSLLPIALEKPYNLVLEVFQGDYTTLCFVVW